MTDLDAFWIGPGCDQKPGLLRSHAASLGMSDNWNSRFFLDPGRRAQHEPFIGGNGVFARTRLDDARPGAGAPDARGNLGHKEFVELLPYVAQTGVEFPVGRRPFPFEVISGGTDDIDLGFFRDFFENFDVPAAVHGGRIYESPEAKALELPEKRHTIVNDGPMIEGSYCLVSFPAGVAEHNVFVNQGYAHLGR
jgi:hypothetical protein